MLYIIILTWNGKKYLSKLYNSLENLNYPKEKYKILFIDSGSTDGGLEYLEGLENKNEIKLIKLKKNLGFAGGNNIGMQSAIDNGAEYVVLLNQDTYVEPDFLGQLVSVAKSDERVGMVQPLILYYQNKNEISSSGNEIHYLGYGWCRHNHKKLPITNYQLPTMEIDYASAAAVLYKVDVLKKIGLFDENYFSYNEDADLCARAKLIGYKTVLAPSSIVYHDFVFPTAKNKQRYYWMEKNRLYFILKFYKFKTLLLLGLINLAMGLGQFIFAIKNGYVWQFVKSRLWFIFNFRKLWRARKQVQKMRVINDKQLIQNFKSEIKYQEVSNLLLDKIGNPMMKWYWNLIKKIL